MTEIERRIEGKQLGQPDYAGHVFGEEQLEKQRHRKWVGGRWDELGALQIEYLVEQGLRPEQRFLDVGCGSLRAGRHLVDHLDEGNYYGIDISHDLIRAGYDHELTPEQRAKLPLANVRVTDRFDADFGVRFDMAIAQSVFTHIPLNQIRLCLYRIAKVMKPGATFFATFFEEAKDFPIDGLGHSRRYTERNPFWYYRRDLRWAAHGSPWTFRYIGRWGHPRDQRMIAFTRTEDDAGS